MTHHKQHQKDLIQMMMIVVVMKNMNLKSQAMKNLNLKNNQPQARSIQHLLRNQPTPNQPTPLLLLLQVLAQRANGNVDRFPQTIIL
jgi:hypothetical protein